MSDNLSTTYAAHIARLRRVAAKHDLGIQKSRCRLPHSNDLGGYMLFDISRNVVVAGDRYDLNLDDVSAFLADIASRPEAPNWGISLSAA